MSARDMDLRKRVGRMIRLYAKDRGVTIREIGEVLGLKSDPPVYERLDGQASITIDDLAAIAKLLSTTPSALLEDPDSILQYGCMHAYAGQDVRDDAA